MENSPFHITSSQLANKDKFRISFRLQVPNFKPVGASNFQTDSQKNNHKEKKDTMTNEIKATIKFHEYEFRRVKTMGNTPIIYTSEEWIGKKVCVIPLPLTITDRSIEKIKKGNTYTLTTPIREIKRMTVRDGRSVGRISAPSSWIGLDVLVIEEPNYDEIY